MHTKTSQMFVPLLVASHNAVVMSDKVISNHHNTNHNNKVYKNNSDSINHNIEQILSKFYVFLKLKNNQIISDKNDKIHGNILKLKFNKQTWRIVLMPVVYKKDDL